MFGMEKLELCGYPMVNKLKICFTRFDTIHKRDGQTDGWMDGQTPHNSIRPCMQASSGKKAGRRDLEVVGCRHV